MPLQHQRLTNNDLKLAQVRTQYAVYKTDPIPLILPRLQALTRSTKAVRGRPVPLYNETFVYCFPTCIIHLFRPINTQQSPRLTPTGQLRVLKFEGRFGRCGLFELSAYSPFHITTIEPPSSTVDLPLKHGRPRLPQCLTP